VEPHLQSDSAAGKRLVLTMNATSSPNLAVEAPGFVALQREMHNALIAQHPEWILPNGDCPTCEFYDARLAELLIQSLPPSRVGTTRQIQ
jgi:hypothetical protein